MESSPERRQQSAEQLRQELLAYIERFGLQATEQDIQKTMAELFRRERRVIRSVIERCLEAATNQETQIDSKLPTLRSLAAQEDSAIGASLTVKTEPGGASRTLALAGAFSLVAAIGSVAIYHSMAPQGGRAVQATVRPLAPVPTPAMLAAMNAEFVVVRVSVNAEQASVLIDGAKVDQLPFEGKWRLDEGMHIVEATAPGFVAQRRLVRFSEDVNLRFELEPAPAPTSTVEADPDADTGLRRSRAGRGWVNGAAPRSIDKRDPYLAD